MLPLHDVNHHAPMTIALQNLTDAKVEFGLDRQLLTTLDKDLLLPLFAASSVLELQNRKRDRFH